MAQKSTRKPFASVPSHPDFVALEKQLLQHWDKSGIVKQYLSKNQKSKKKFSFLDGPITANNPMGVHHGRGRSYKDLWQRFFTMKGYRQRYQNGFDCQGLWVEVEVEKDLGFKNKKDIQAYGVEKFVNQCKARVKKYSAIQTKQSQRLGMWMDWDNSYYTMSDKNNYTIWHFLKTCHQRNWIYKGHDSVPWCPRCETAISQHEMLTEDYKEVTHKAIYLALPLEAKNNEYLLIWTTTPWTIPANIAVALDSKIKYSLVEAQNHHRYWLAHDLVKAVFGSESHKIIKTLKGQALVGLKYRGPFDDLPAVAQVKQAHPDTFHTVVATDTKILPISTTEGTGLVHTAVSAGSEDYKLGQKLGLPMIPVIADDASYFSGFGSLSRKNAKTHPELIFDFIKQQQKKTQIPWVYKIHNYRHRYPACWRCKTELVWKVTDEWYIAMDRPDPTHPQKHTLRQQLKAITKQINWIPGFGLERELDWLKNMHDWLISKKNRFWGLALPIYECSHCHHFEVIGSQAELKKKAVKGWDKFAGHSPHKPWIDEIKIKCSHCGQLVSRIEPVGNPWLDAGIVPFSTMSSAWFPADFITEAFPGQFKNWFYAMLVMSAVLKKTPPYQTVLGYESVVGEDGRPMHKSWGNAIEFNEGAEKIGVDVMRWLYAKPAPAALLPFGYKPADEIRRQFILILWNSYRFFVTQANSDHWRPPKNFNLKPAHLLDQWILSRLHQTINLVTQSLDKYYSAPATEALENFVSDFSTWYIRRSRDRVGVTASDNQDKQQCYQTIYLVLTTLSQLLAPIIPYLSDHIYTSLTQEKSVHLTDWPKLNRSLIKPQLEKDMQRARQVVEKIHSQRKATGLKVRQPLAQVTVSGPRFGNSALHQLILEETNIKQLNFTKTKKDLQVKLETKLTPRLKAEGQAREIIRQIQQARKQAGTRLDQKINLQLPDWPEDFTDLIKQKALVNQLKKGPSLKLIK